MRLSPTIRRPKLVNYVAPVYPPPARGTRIEGDVRIDAIIDTSGQVVDVKVLGGHPILVGAAMRAVKQWIYEPTYVNGHPVPVVFAVTIHFQLG